MKRLKFIQAGFEQYTGEIGMYEFVDGLSTEAVSRAERDRLSVAFQFAEIDVDGNEEPAGIAHRIIAERAMFAEVDEGAARQTDEEKLAEIRLTQANALKAKVTRFYSGDELEKIAEKGGIKALRGIAEPLGVKSKSIPALMGMIVAAQEVRQAHQEEQRKQREARDAELVAVVAAESITKPVVVVEPVTDEAATDEEVAKAVAAVEEIAAAVAQENAEEAAAEKQAE